MGLSDGTANEKIKQLLLLLLLLLLSLLLLLLLLLLSVGMPFLLWVCCGSDMGGFVDIKGCSSSYDYWAMSTGIGSEPGPKSV